ELHLLLQRPARSLDDASFDLVLETVRVDDLPGVGSCHHPCHAHESIGAINDAVGNQRDIALGGFIAAECDTATMYPIAFCAGHPTGCVCSGGQHALCARILEVPQSE